MNNDENHRTRWSKDEVEFLQSQWDGTKETTEMIAEILGRTINAVAQRHYEILWGQRTIEEHPFNKETPLARVSRPTVKVRREAIIFEVDPDRICPQCWTIKSATGDCLC